jgi:hypothetical protein
MTRLRIARACQPADDEGPRALQALARNRHTRARLHGRPLTVWEYIVQDGRERVAATLAVGVLAHGTTPVPPAMPPAQEAAARAHRDFTVTAARRIETIRAAIDLDAARPTQPGLFERRPQFARAALTAEREDTRRWLAERAEELQKSGELVLPPPRLRLVLVPPA